MVALRKLIKISQLSQCSHFWSQSSASIIMQWCVVRVGKTPCEIGSYQLVISKHWNFIAGRVTSDVHVWPTFDGFCYIFTTIAMEPTIITTWHINIAAKKATMICSVAIILRSGRSCQLISFNASTSSNYILKQELIK